MADELDTGPGNQENQPQESTDELRAKLAQTEADIQKLKGHWGTEKSEMIAQIAELRGQIGEHRFMETRSQDETTADPYTFSDEQLDEFRDDPTKLIDVFRTRETSLAQMVLGALKERDTDIESRLSAVSTDLGGLKRATDPEVIAWREAITSLKENEAFKELDDKTLIAIAKEKNLKPAMQYSGSAGGSRMRTGDSPKEIPFVPSGTDSVTKFALHLAGGDVKRAEKFWNSAVEASRRS